jgi:hypothetical protein
MRRFFSVDNSSKGVIVDNAEGMHSGCTVYSDMDTDLETLSPSQPHRDVDLAVVQADTEGTPHSSTDILDPFLFSRLR